VQINAGLKTLHQVGQLYLNLKLRSILIAKNEVSDTYNVLLIDFSQCMSYLSENGDHINEIKNNAPKGSKLAGLIRFSRRDDSIKLF
jgi:hypothetical protein